MRSLFFTLLLATIFGCTKPENKEIDKKNNSDDRLQVLLIGTFHFNNFNPENNTDLTKSDIIDVLQEEYQKELEYLSNKIAEFNPDKIFVEAQLSNQERLDELYNSFDKPYNKSSRNEIWQLAMRTSKKLGHSKLYAFDYRKGIQFPYKQMIETMKAAGQQKRVEKDNERRKAQEAKSRENVRKRKTLKQMLLEMNEPAEIKKSIDWYLNFCNTAGALKDTMGVFLTSEWYKRNLYMYSLIQKQVEDKDQKIMVLSGASHTTLQRQFIERNPDWKIIELKEVLQ